MKKNGALCACVCVWYSPWSVPYTEDKQVNWHDREEQAKRFHLIELDERVMILKAEDYVYLPYRVISIWPYAVWFSK